VEEAEDAAFLMLMLEVEVEEIESSLFVE